MTKMMMSLMAISIKPLSIFYNNNQDYLLIPFLVPLLLTSDLWSEAEENGEFSSSITTQHCVYLRRSSGRRLKTKLIVIIRHK